jgi:hypothetical protein
MIYLITTLLKQKEEYEEESIFEVPVCGSTGTGSIMNGSIMNGTN